MNNLICNIKSNLMNFNKPKSTIISFCPNDSYYYDDIIKKLHDYIYKWLSFENKVFCNSDFNISEYLSIFSDILNQIDIKGKVCFYELSNGCLKCHSYYKYYEIFMYSNECSKIIVKSEDMKYTYIYSMRNGCYLEKIERFGNSFTITCECSHFETKFDMYTKSNHVQIRFIIPSSYKDNNTIKTDCIRTIRELIYIKDFLCMERIINVLSSIYTLKEINNYDIISIFNYELEIKFNNGTIINSFEFKSPTSVEMFLIRDSVLYSACSKEFFADFINNNFKLYEKNGTIVEYAIDNDGNAEIKVLEAKEKLYYKQLQREISEKVENIKYNYNKLFNYFT